MNGFHLRIRDRLPGLWRPGDDPGDGEVLALAAADIAGLNGERLAPGRRRDGHDAVIVELSEPTDISIVGTNRPLPPDALVLLYRLDENGHPYHLPGAIARVVEGNEAALDEAFRAQRFALRMRRPDLLSRWLRAVGGELAAVHNGAGEVQQGHWYPNADSALTHPWVMSWHQVDGSRPPRRGEDEVLHFPYLLDLARVGSLLDVAPWIDPPGLRDTVESYRTRLLRIVALYRRGLGTRGALWRMTEAQLPQDLSQPAPLRDRAFAIEECAMLVEHDAMATTRAQPEDVVAPLMRWNLSNGEAEPASHDIVIVSVADDGEIADTVDPLIELERAGDAALRLGLGVRADVPAGKALLCRHTWMSLIAGPGGLRQAHHADDPAAPGPWNAVDGAPAGQVQALAQTVDRWLYLAVESGADTAALWRWDGRRWQEMASGLPTVHCMLAEEGALLIGSAGGQLRFQPPQGGAVAQLEPPAAERTGPAVFALLHDGEGERWRGTARGLERWRDGAWHAAGVHAELGIDTPVSAIHLDRGGNLFAGGPFGLVQWQKRSGRWFVYSGVSTNDDDPDWVPLGDALPDDTQLGLPAVHAILRTSDESLWLGTDAGVARWHAQRYRNTYTTLLTAYPHLGTGAVHRLAEDARGRLWVAGEDGLRRCSGRDWWQVESNALVRLGAPPRPRAGEDPVLMRYERGGGWRYHDPEAADDWLPVPADASAASQDPVRHILWCDTVEVELGTLDGDLFSPESSVPAGQLVMRYKPSEGVIEDGGIPAVPRLPPGVSTWRYLRLEGASPREAAADLPAWTSEGRLLPPGGTPTDPDATDLFRDSASWPGRFETIEPPPASDWSEVAFSYPPTARVRHRWRGRAAMTALVRLHRRPGEDSIHPVVLDRVWRGLQQVKPAGVTVALAVDETIVRGNQS